MIDVEQLIVEELDQLVPAPPGTWANWQDVERRAEHTVAGRPRRRLVLVCVAAVAVVFATVALAGTLGGGFSAWLSGQPGKPASTSEQQAFARAIRSWHGFPRTTELRELVRTRARGDTFTLFGFRGAGSLCLRLTVSGRDSDVELVCPPLTALQHAGPAVVAAVDRPVGSGTRVTNGPFDFALPRAQVTFGIVTDRVARVELVHSDGRRTRASISGDAFLSVDTGLSPTERVTRIRAIDPSGARAAIPFSAGLQTFAGGGPGVSAASAVPGGPVTVQRVVHGGAIRWLARREPRGRPVPANVHHIVGVLPSVLFAREVTPNPRAPERLVVSVLPANGRFGPHVRNPLQVCAEVVGGRYANQGGGCWPAGRLFSTNPFTYGIGRDASAQVTTIAGLASDEVARLVLFSANHARSNVAIHDNGFIVEAALADYPLRLVASDRSGRVIGIVTFQPPDQGRANLFPPASRPVLNAPWHVVFRTPLATLWSGPSQSGGTCTVLRYAGARSVPPFCSVDVPLPRDAIGGFGIQGGKGTGEITVRAGAGVARVVVHLEGGRTQSIPVRAGYAIAKLDLESSGLPVSRQIRFLDGLDAAGRLVATTRRAQGGASAGTRR